MKELDSFTERQGWLSVQLAKSNINILRCEDNCIYYEYQFRMKNGQYKWAKAVYIRRAGGDLIDELLNILDLVRDIRIEAEE